MIDRRGQHDATRGFERQGLLGARGGGSAASADVMGGWANERGEGRRGEVGEGREGERPEGREGEARESWCGPRRTRTSRAARAPRRRTICRSSRSTPQPWGRG